MDKEDEENKENERRKKRQLKMKDYTRSPRRAQKFAVQGLHVRAIQVISSRPLRCLGISSKSLEMSSRMR